jgi:hypothetical protein
LETHNAYFIKGWCIPKPKAFFDATPLLFWVVWFLCMSFIVLGWFQLFNPKPDLPGEWFQRAGSLVVGFALAAEFSARYTINKLIRNREHPNNFINKSGMGASKDEIELNKTRDVSALISIDKVCEGMNIFFVFIGTVIWGYGDIIFYKLS